MVITFDFDDTLIKWFEDENENRCWKINHSVFSQLLFFSRNGFTVFVVTSRHKVAEHRQRLSIVSFLEGVGLSHIPVIFTNGKLKVETLLRINSRMHFDDDELELEALGSHLIPAIQC